jgi:outer membrane protein OmpA-like peptidoglycan-associated protein
MLAESMKYNGKYDEAAAQFSAFDRGKYRDKKGETYHAMAKSEILACQKAKQLVLENRVAYITHAGENVNVGYSDFAPRLPNDSTMVFSSYNSDTILTSEYLEPNFNRVKLYTSSFDKEENIWSKPAEMKHLSRHLESTSNGVYTPEGDEFYYTRCRNGRRGQMVCDIYMCKIKDGKFSKPIHLGKNINTPGSTQTQPYVVTIPNGKQTQKILYFASNRKGSKGGMDIWYSVFNNKIGLYDRPINCGDAINSVRDEVTPFYNVEENTLYFSSNSHAGLGGFDVFKAKGSLKSFSNAENMKAPINSTADDVYYTQSHKRATMGYMVSNRPGGKSVFCPTCADDIYAFDLEGPIEFGRKKAKPEPKPDTSTMVVNTVPVEEPKQVIEEKPVQEVVAKVVEPEPKPEPKVEEKPAPVVAEKPVVEKTKKPTKQRKPKKAVEPKPEVTPEPKPEVTPEPEPEPEFKTVVTKRKTRVLVEFATDKDAAYLEYYPKLDSISQIIAADTNIYVMITGHTDSRGTFEHNQGLSERRAKAMFDYLVEHGVRAQNLSMKGEGERKPIDSNFTVKGRRHNRRAEFLYTITFSKQVPVLKKKRKK